MVPSLVLSKKRKIKLPLLILSKYQVKVVATDDAYFLLREKIMA
jgi:hypothetical protein